MRRLFILRPQPAAGRSVETAASMGLDALAIPLFTLEPVEWAVPDCGDFDALLLTSANAVNLAGTGIEQLRSLPVHAVGAATALAAEVAGFGLASRGQSGVDDLLGSIAPGTRLLHLCGEDRRLPNAPSHSITRLTVYRARALPNVEGLEALDGAVAAIHSPRAGRRLAELVGEEHRRGVRLAAISAPAAEAAGTGWMDVQVARAPNDHALLALAARLCET